MDNTSTDMLRISASKWSLAGDDCLLNLLQNSHQKIISKCKDVTAQLQDMTSALDDAAIDLQNVNNKFMALSNSQFIESRVYDDEEDLASDAAPVKELQPQVIDEISMLKNSLAILERTHEIAEILDDSDSDSDMEISVVLKPKDMYCERPLPYIIGTPSWKNKWHAGLVVEESDTDSCTSRHGDADLDQFSDTDTEEEHAVQQQQQQTISSVSPSPPPERAARVSPVRHTPSDVAAELARRLGGPVQRIPEPEEYSPPVPTTKKVYKPELPATSTIFSDEPPPLDAVEVEVEVEEEDSQSEDEDIFAEINRKKPYTQRNKGQNKLADDLFSFDKSPVDDGDIFSDFVQQGETKPSKQKSTLFQEESEPELFADPQNRDVLHNTQKEQTNTKKPVGGISLFGSNKGTESIGAAILKRNQRKSSLSDDEAESETETPKSLSENNENTTKTQSKDKAIDEIDNQPLKKEKDILKDLFGKPEKSKTQKIVKSAAKSTVITKPETKETTKKDTKNLFSDNIFDDIDDIFTSDVKVKIPPKESNQKSIFDDDDDLFSEITTKPQIAQSASITNNQKINAQKSHKSIFDSDDDLFSDVNSIDKNKPDTKSIESEKCAPNNVIDNIHKAPIKGDINASCNVESNVRSTEIKKELNTENNLQKTKEPQIKSKSLFDSDSDDDIFANIKKENKAKVLNSDNDNLKESKDLFADNDVKIKSNTVFKPSDVHSSNNADFIDDEDLFTTAKDTKTNLNNNVLLNNDTKKSEIKAPEKLKVENSPSLFNEEDIDDLFIKENKMKTVAVEKDLKTGNISKIVEKHDTIKKTVAAITEDKTIGENKSKLPDVYSVNTDKRLLIEQTDADKLNPNNNQELDIQDFEETLPEDDLFTASKVDIISPAKDDIFSIPKDESTSLKNIQNIRDEKVLEDTITEIVKSKAENKLTIIKDDLLETKASNSESVTPLKDENTLNVKNNENIVETPKAEISYQSIFDDFIEKKDILKSLQQKSVSNALFDDIFTEPPAFEKPTESKKSKNVNALFDDDSDDESLFFKKNDVISDEKPELFTSSANFDLFVNEPPAIDVDFTSKTNNFDDDIDIFSPLPITKNTPVASKSSNFDNNDDILDSTPKSKETVPNFIPETPNVNNTSQTTEAIQPTHKDTIFTTPELEKHSNSVNIVNKKSKLAEAIDSDEDIFSSLPKPKLPNKPIQDPKISNIEKSDEFDDIFAKDSPKKDSEPKKIGKLNTKHFNINVNALIPGASPKKVAKDQKDEQNMEQKEPEKLTLPNDEIDFKPKSHSNKEPVELPDENDFIPKAASNKDENEVTKVETDKSITFDEKPQSDTLDNKVSKQRARIQVKRRPSSRRARHEAVRKSGIDFGDETDNSSSIDEPVKINTVDSNTRSIIDVYSKDTYEDSKAKSKEMESYVDKNRYEIGKDNTEHKNIPTTIDKIDSIDNNNILKDATSEIKTDFKQTIEQKSTTKVVYILNDEDIFNTGQSNKDLNKITENETRNIAPNENEFDDIFDINSKLDENDDIFKSTGIKTLGKSYEKQTESTKDRIESTKNIENSTKLVEKNAQNDEIKTKKLTKISIFEDSDEELFNKPKIQVKKTVFDSDSEEDLFGKKTEKQNKEQKNREVKNEEVKKKEVSKVVKVSLFGDDDDDDDLFGVRKEKQEPKRQSSQPSTSKETSQTSPKMGEPVFDDPLSMLGDVDD